jgi:Na+:H+ antiporter, NhaA family
VSLRRKRIKRSVVRRFFVFSRGDRAAGITLTLATVGALIWANVAPGSYQHFWALTPSTSRAVGLPFSLRDWANQGLMTVFFALVGLEIRREVSSGELRSWRRASVPVAAAMGGMVVPAAIYIAVIHGSTGSRGWGIPMATDVAFAVGALALVGARTSPRLRVFLMTLAVADDIASIVILICFYSTGLDGAPLLLGLICILAMAAIEAVRPAWIGPQMLLGAVGWFSLARGGVEAAVIGVAIGAMALPSPVEGAWARLRGPRGWEQRIQPWLTLGVLPVFALANAGVSIRQLSASTAGVVSVFVAVVVARVIGKPLGIGLMAWVLRKVPSGLYDPGLAGRDVLGVGALASVGFTVPLLVIRVALPDGPLAESATLGLLVGSLLGAVAGIIVLRIGRRRPAAATVRSEPMIGEASPNGDRPQERPASSPSPLAWALIAACIIAALDTVTGRRVVLLGSLAAVPVIATLSRRTRDVLLASLSALCLGVILGFPDHVWGSYEHAAFLAAIVVVCVVDIAATAVLQKALTTGSPHDSPLDD